MSSNPFGGGRGRGQSPEDSSPGSSPMSPDDEYDILRRVANDNKDSPSSPGDDSLTCPSVPTSPTSPRGNGDSSPSSSPGGSPGGNGDSPPQPKRKMVLQRMLTKILENQANFTREQIQELPEVLMDNFGLKSIALKDPCTSLPGISLHSDAFDPALIKSNDGDALRAAGGGQQRSQSGVGRGELDIPKDENYLLMKDGSGPGKEGKKLWYGRMDVGRANTSDMVHQLITWKGTDKLILPDYIEIEAINTVDAPVYRQELEEKRPPTAMEMIKEQQEKEMQDVGETASSGAKLDVELKLLHDGLDRKSPRAKREGIKRTYSRGFSEGSFKPKRAQVIPEEDMRCLNRMPVARQDPAGSSDKASRRRSAGPPPSSGKKEKKKSYGLGESTRRYVVWQDFEPDFAPLRQEATRSKTQRDIAKGVGLVGAAMTTTLALAGPGGGAKKRGGTGGATVAMGLGGEIFDDENLDGSKEGGSKDGNESKEEDDFGGVDEDGHPITNRGSKDINQLDEEGNPISIKKSKRGKKGKKGKAKLGAGNESGEVIEMDPKTLALKRQQEDGKMVAAQLAFKHPDNKLVLFRPCARLKPRAPERKEVFDRELICTCPFIIDGVVLGVRLEIDEKGMVIHDSMRDHLEKKRALDEKAEEKVEEKEPPPPEPVASEKKHKKHRKHSKKHSTASAAAAASPESPVSPQAPFGGAVGGLVSGVDPGAPKSGGRMGFLKTLTDTFKKAARKALDSNISFIGRPFTAELFEQWLQASEMAGPLSWEVGPIELKRTAEIRKKFFSSSVPQCPFGHKLNFHRYGDLGWSHMVKIPCRTCGKAQNHGVEICKRRCQWYGCCENCAKRWAEANTREWAASAVMKLDMGAKKPGKSSNMFRDNKIDLVFPVVDPKKNPVAFLRFGMILNVDHKIYMAQPFDFDSRVIAEFASLSSSGVKSIEERRKIAMDVRNRFTICNAEPVQGGLQVLLDCVLWHTFLGQASEFTRHKRSEDQWVTVETKVAAMVSEAPRNASKDEKEKLRNTARVVSLYASNTIDEMLEVEASLENTTKNSGGGGGTERSPSKTSAGKEGKDNNRGSFGDRPSGPSDGGRQVGFASQDTIDLDEENKKKGARPSRTESKRLAIDNSHVERTVARNAIDGTNYLATLKCFSAAGKHLEGLVSDVPNTMQRARRSLIHKGYPMLAKMTKIIPLCSVVARNKVESLEFFRKRPEAMPLERRLMCPSGCGAQVFDHQLDYHLTTVCKKRVTPCELGCGMTIRYDLMGRHVAFDCIFRGIKCGFCDEVVLASELDYHHKRKCEGQMGKCELCKAEMRSSELTNHMKYMCGKRDTECNWCGAITTYEQKRTLNKFAFCPKRWGKAKELCELVYMGIDNDKIYEMINDGAHPTLGRENGKEEWEHQEELQRSITGESLNGAGARFGVGSGGLGGRGRGGNGNGQDGSEDRDVLGMLPVPPASAGSDMNGGGHGFRAGTPGFAGLPTSAGGPGFSRPGTSSVFDKLRPGTSAGGMSGLPNINSTRPGTSAGGMTSSYSGGGMGMGSRGGMGMSSMGSRPGTEINRFPLDDFQNNFQGGMVPGISELRDGYTGRPETDQGPRRGPFPRFPQGEKAPGSQTNIPLGNSVMLDCFIQGRAVTEERGWEEHVPIGHAEQYKGILYQTDHRPARQVRTPAPAPVVPSTWIDDGNLQGGPYSQKYPAGVHHYQFQVNRTLVTPGQFMAQRDAEAAHNDGPGASGKKSRGGNRPGTSSHSTPIKVVGNYGSPQKSTEKKTRGLLLTTPPPAGSAGNRSGTGSGSRYKTPLPPISEPRGTSTSPEKRPPFGKTADDYYQDYHPIAEHDEGDNTTAAGQSLSGGPSTSDQDIDKAPPPDSLFVGLGLHICAVVDNVELAELFVEAGANLELVDRFGRTALHVAGQYGSDGVLKLLCDLPIAEELALQKDFNDRTALYTAAFYKQIQCTNLLYDFSEDVLSPRTMTHTEPIMNVLRYDERREVGLKMVHWNVIGMFDPPKPSMGLLISRRKKTGMELLSEDQLKKITTHQDELLKKQDALGVMKGKLNEGAQLDGRAESAAAHVMEGIKRKEKEALAKRLGVDVDDLESEEDVDGEDEEDDDDE